MLIDLFCGKVFKYYFILKLNGIKGYWRKIMVFCRLMGVKCFGDYMDES